MPKEISELEEFSLVRGGRTDTYRRELDDPNPVFECERMRVTHLSCSMVVNFKSYTFPAEQEWFKQRKLIAKENDAHNSGKRKKR